MKRLIAIIVPLVILGALIAWRVNVKRTDQATQARSAQMRAKAPLPVTMATVAVHDVVTTFQVTGTLAAPQDVKLTPKVTGRINFLQVHEGDRVKKGQVLVRLDPTETAAQVQQKQATVAQKSAVITQNLAIIEQKQAAIADAKHKLSQAKLTQAPNNSMVQTQIAQQEAAVSSAKADYAQVRENYNAQVAAANAAVTDAQGRVTSAKAMIANAKASITSAKANLDDATNKFNRTSELYKQGFVAAQDVDDAKAAVAVQQAGVEVAQGQLQSALAALDSALAQQQAAEQQVSITKTTGVANIEASRAKLVQAQESLKYAKVNTAQTPAYEESLQALRAEVNSANADLDSARANLGNARADLRSAQADLRNMTAQLTDTVLICPLDGFVTARYMDPGGMASPATPIIEVQFVKQIWVTFTVSESISAKLHFGQAVDVSIDALPNSKFSANIVQMNASADTTSRQFTIRATINNAENRLKPGMFAHVTMVTDRLDGATVVPLEAIQPDGKSVVTVETVKADQPDGKDQYIAHITPVETGPSDAQYTSIVSGVKSGDKVVLISAFPLKEGQNVRLDDGKQKSSDQSAPGSSHHGTRGT